MIFSLSSSFLLLFLLSVHVPFLCLAIWWRSPVYMDDDVLQRFVHCAHIINMRLYQHGLSSQTMRQTGAACPDNQGWRPTLNDGGLLRETWLMTARTSHTPEESAHSPRGQTGLQTDRQTQGSRVRRSLLSGTVAQGLWERWQGSESRRASSVSAWCPTLCMALVSP